ncbi:MAG: hypothetical protein ABIQ52_03550 [Vicinamibacterales bacterium]
MTPTNTGADEEMDRDGLERLLEHLRVSRGFDFTAYKRSTLARRIVRRMLTVGMNGFPEYGAYPDGRPDEFEALFNTILINVTTSSAIRTSGMCCGTTSCPGCWRHGRRRMASACGARVARQVRNHTAW